MRNSTILGGLVLGATLSLGLPACNEDGATASDLPPPTLPDTVVTTTYPKGPYGVQPGQVITDFAFMGFPQPMKARAVLEPIHLSDFYNPHASDATYAPSDPSADDRLFPKGSVHGEGTPKPKALAINIGAIWCGPCNNEAKTELPVQHAKYHPLGGEFLFQLADGAMQGTAATQKDLFNWTTKYKVDYPATIDDKRLLASSFASTSYPANLIVDLRTMRIVTVVTGPPDSTYWATFEATLAGE